MKKITLPISVKSGNRLLKKKWYYYYNYKKNIFKIMGLMLRKNDNGFYKYITITTYKKRKLDYDNMVIGLKPVVDMLKSKGYIYDDDEKSVKIAYKQLNTKDKEKIIIELIR